MGIAAHELDEEDAVRRILLEFPRLEPLLDREGGALSGGEQQLLAIARCLVSEPELVLLDEPTEGIQPSIVDEIIDLLRDLNRRRGVAIVLVEQSLDFITELSNRVMLLQKGAITGVIAGSDAVNPALIEEFTGFGGGSDHALPHHVEPTVAVEPSATLPAPASPEVPMRPVLSERIAFMTVQRPTHAQLRDIVEELGMHMTDARIQEFLDVMQARSTPTTSSTRCRTTCRRSSIRARPGSADTRGEPVQCLVREDRGAGSAPGAVAGTHRGAEGQRVSRRRTDDEWRLDAEGLYARCRRDHRHPASRCRRDYRRQGPLRVFLPVGRIPHQRGRTGPDPHKAGFSAGGSSSGSGALVGGGLVDMAIGGDQGGSIRMPASFCGCYGLKPTHGLVPYTGVMPIETTIDHTGPMTANVIDNAVMLEVLAGPDGLDPRQYNVETDRYSLAVTRGVSGLKIGVVKEGFGRAESQGDVDIKVRAAADMLARLGATVDEVSIPGT